MLRKRSTSRSPRELLAKFLDQADFFVGKGVRYTVAFLVGVTTVVIIIAIVSITRSKSSGDTANMSSTNFVTTRTIITKVITSGVSTGTSSSPSSIPTTRASTHKSTNASTTTTSTTTSTKRSTKQTFTTSATIYARNTTKSITTTKPPAQQAIHCACAVDLHNLNNDTNLLQKEKGLVIDIAEKVFENFESSTAGLWVYGFVKKTAAKVFSKVFDEMLDNFGKFSEDATEKMVFGPHFSPQYQNLTDAINNGVDVLNVTNCLLLLSAMNEVSESWRIEPSYAYKRIVIVSVQGTNFTNHVDSRGIAVNVPLDYTPSDVDTVFQAIASGFT